jgi:hypothetical protein
VRGGENASKVVEKAYRTRVLWTIFDVWFVIYPLMEVVIILNCTMKYTERWLMKAVSDFET